MLRVLFVAFCFGRRFGGVGSASRGGVSREDVYFSSKREERTYETYSFFGHICIGIFF